jgi:hypothetical protein
MGQRSVVDGRYAILAPSGDGGTGRVYLARDELLAHHCFATFRGG